MMVRIVFLGDSDISRWPPSLYPTIKEAGGEDCVIRCVNIAQGGAVISDMQTQLKTWRDGDDEDETNTLFVACAGENDVSSGQSIDKIQKAFTSFLEELFRPNSSSKQMHQQSQNLIFLGPKFEPWLTEDYASRKQYTKLSSALERTIRKNQEPYSQNIVYVDCLTKFCTAESKGVPGAVLGGRAMPDRTYFDSDELHLSDEGYKVWREIITEKIQRILCDT
jgi:lysophospholipase L1-like esterase